MMKKMMLLALTALMMLSAAAWCEAARAPRLKQAVIVKVGNDAEGNMYTPLADGSENFIYGDKIFLQIKYLGHPSGSESFFYQYGNLIGRISAFETEGSLSANGETIVSYTIPLSRLPQKTQDMIGQISVAARGSNGGYAETSIYNLWKAEAPPPETP